GRIGIGRRGRDLEGHPPVLYPGPGLGGRGADRAGCLRLAAIPGLADDRRSGGDRRATARVRPPVQRLSRPGIPELAQDRRAALTVALSAAGLVALAPEAGLAQIALKSPARSELSAQEREVLAPLASDWDRM